MYRHIVQYYETDKMGITHHSNYIRWMEEARIDFLRQIGFGYDRLEAEGIMSPVVSISCDYKTSCTFPEEISIDVQVEEFKGVKLKLSYTMKNARGEIVCEATSDHCFLNPEGRFIRMKKECPELYEALLALLTEK